MNPYSGSDATKSEQVEEMFDSIAPAYDFMNTAMTFGLHRYWRDCALRRLRKSAPQSILDVATGTGDVAFRMLDKLNPRRIVGMDLSAGMLDVARRKLRKDYPGSEDRIEFRTGNCLALDFPDNGFDAVTVAYGVRNFERLQQGYAEMLRVLRPGGVLCVVELSEPRNRIVKSLYRLYARHIIPFIGKIVSGDSDAYSYLPASIAAAPQRDDMTAMMRSVGFVDTEWRQLTFGTVCIYTARKPQANAG